MMNKKLIIGLLAGVLVVGVGYTLTKGDGEDASSSDSAKTADSKSSVTSATGKYDGDLKGLSGDGKSRKCTSKYTVSGSTADITIYTDGSGRLRYELTGISGVSSSDGSSTMILKDNKAYYWASTAGGSFGFVYAVSDEDFANATSGLPSGTEALGGNFSLDCENWDVDSAKFDQPSDVTFTSITTVTTTPK